MSLSYESSGVHYGPLDAFKRACQKAALTTTDLLAGHGLREPAAVRGESAYLIEAEDHYLAHVEEGLGTKNLVADAMQAATGETKALVAALRPVARVNFEALKRLSGSPYANDGSPPAGPIS